MEQFIQLISILMSSQIQAQIFHRQTKSFSEHMALGTYYDEIVDIVDGLVESYQGKYDILKKYSPYDYVDYTNNEQVVAYFEELCNQVYTLRGGLTDSYIQNQIDALEELLYSTKYKLRFLK